MKTLFLGDNLRGGRDLHKHNNIAVRRPNSYCEVLKNILKRNHLLSGLMFHMQAFAAQSELQNFSPLM